MSTKETKVILHSCGGCGINIGSLAYEKYANLKREGFSKLLVNFLDTSKANISPIDKIGGKLHQVSSNKASVEEISGSGSERASNIEDSKVSVKKYLDDVNVTKDSPSDIHVVVISASGGSGSSVGVLLLRELLLKDCAVSIVVVGDNDNQLYTINTLKTLESLIGLSKVMKKIITVYYVNNSFYKGGLHERQGTVDSVVMGYIYSLLLITASSNKELDKADVRALFKQSSFKTITLPFGISLIEDFSKVIDEKDGCSTTLVRTITDNLENIPNETNALHTKVGLILNKNVLSSAKRFLPISLVTKSGCMTNIINIQNERIEYWKDVANNLSKDCIDVECDEDTGLVF